MNTQVDKESSKLASEDRAAVAAFVEKGERSLKQPFFHGGTQLMAEGRAVARGRRLEWEERPVVGEVGALADAIIAPEQRVEVDVQLADWRIAPAGRLESPLSEASYALGALAYDDLVSLAPDVEVPRNVNAWLMRSPKSSKLRERKRADGSLEAFAFVSGRYTAFDLDKVAAVVAEAMPADAHAAVKYDRDRAKWSIDVSYANPRMLADNYGVGEAHRVGVRVRGQDGGRSGIQIRPFAERVRCVNCTIITDHGVRVSHRHSGQALALQEALGKSLLLAGEALESFGKVWREANERRIVDKYDGSPLSAEESFRRLIAHEYVKVPGVKKSDLLAGLMAAWEREPGDVAAHVNMALTAYAQGVESWSRAEDLEEQAGELLYQHVYQLAPLEEGQAKLFV